MHWYWHTHCFSDVHSLGGLWYMLLFLVSSLSFGFTTHQDPGKSYPSQATDADSPFLLGNSSNLMSLLIVTRLFWRTKSWQPELSVTFLFQHITAGEKGSWFVLTQASLVLRDQEGGWQAAFGFLTASCRMPIVARTKWLLVNVYGKLYLMASFSPVFKNFIKDHIEKMIVRKIFFILIG